MNFTRLAKLDDLLGEYLCRGALLLPGSTGKRDRREKPRIIVAKLRSIGDVVLALPMVQALKESGAEVVFLSGKVNRQWLKLQPYIDRVIAVDLETLWRSPRFLLLLRGIRRERADAYIDLTQSSHFAAVICHLSAAPMRIGFETLHPGKRCKNRMYTHLIPFDNGRHIVHNYFALLDPLGVAPPPAIVLPRLHDTAADEERVRSFIDEVNVDRRELVGVHLSGTIPAKRWPPERWAETIASLISAKRRVIAVGGNGEGPAIEVVRSCLKRDANALVNAAGCFTLPQLFALMRHFRFFLANDGGPMHVAAAMGVPTLGLFGPETPVRYAPFSENGLFLYKGDELACSPCSKPYMGSWPTCRRPLCLERIDSVDVLRALETLLSLNEKAPMEATG